MKHHRLILPLLRPVVAAWIILIPSTHAAQPTPETDPARLEFFEKRVRPVLVENCYNCHSADTKPAGGLRVDDRRGLLAGGDTGPALVPGDPGASLILKRIRHDDPKRRMPKEGRSLTREEAADLAQWIQDGAAWPAPVVPAHLGQGLRDYAHTRTNHWAWQPISNPAPPPTRDTRWARDPIDQFILARLESRHLHPVADAAPIQWLRRVTFDLIGLPPTRSETDDFLADLSTNSRARVVDRLLASPQFGERWGRHWLDVARYGESTGPSRNIPFPHAWKYRDYVIDAVQRDVPYNRLILEQLAGDLLPAKDETERNRLSIATGFLALGVKDVNQRFKTRFIMDNVSEQVDTVTRSFIGLTVSCARCHDHKFDPIPTTDYYALAGIFTSTDDCAGVRSKMGGGGLDYYAPEMLIRLSTDLPPPPADQVARLETEVAEAKKAWDAIRGTPEGLKLATNGLPTQRPFRVKYEKLRAELLSLTDPVSRGAATHGVRDSQHIADTEVRLRGETERLGPVVQRGFLTAFPVPGAPTISPSSSGRLELAQWLTHPSNPLTARVAVNRIWSHLFGTGLVSTSDNFGVKGDKPSHPDLLDHLAVRFAMEGWSTKRLIRHIVLSRSYGLGSDAPRSHTSADPANRLLWRHSPRRLEAEEFRDALLATSGELNPTAPDIAPVSRLPMIEIRDNGPEARKIREAAAASKHRSVYLPLLRGITPATLEAFDPVDQTLVSVRRESTTVPSQALYLLNSVFVRQQSLALARRLLADHPKAGHDAVTDAYRRLFGRTPDAAEVRKALAFIRRYQSEFIAPTHDRPIAFVTVPTTEKQGVPEPSTTGGAANPDDIDRSDDTPAEPAVTPDDSRTAAWAAFAQALYASAEFRFVR